MTGLQVVLVSPEIIYKMWVCTDVHFFGERVQNFDYIFKGIYDPKMIKNHCFLKHSLLIKQGRLW